LPIEEGGTGEKIHDEEKEKSLKGKPWQLKIWGEVYDALKILRSWGFRLEKTADCLKDKTLHKRESRRNSNEREQGKRTGWGQNSSYLKRFASANGEEGRKEKKNRNRKAAIKRGDGEGARHGDIFSIRARNVGGKFSVGGADIGKKKFWTTNV